MANHVSDQALLERFVTRREEAAFAVLVARHGPRVLGACRRILRNEHDAEDAVQATFLLLARKAGDISWRDSVGGWLCAAAQRLSLHARAGAARRCRREQPLAVLVPGGPEHDVLPLPETAHPQADPLAEIARRELRRVLDDELGRLPEKYRVPVVLCYLDGMTNEQAARALGWPAGSMSRRLERARSMLRQRLAGRGLSLTLLVVLLASGIATLRISGHTDSRPRRGMVPPRRATASLASHQRAGREIERLLSMVEEDGSTATAGPRALLAARAAASSAAQLEASRPDSKTKPALWEQHRQTMRSAAFLLAQVSTEHDAPALRAAARRLSTSCTQCHLAALRP